MVYSYSSVFECKRVTVSDDPHMLTVEEVAARLRLHPRTISNMAQRGDIPAIKIARRWRFLPSVVEELYKQRRKREPNE